MFIFKIKCVPIIFSCFAELFRGFLKIDIVSSVDNQSKRVLRYFSRACGISSSVKTEKEKIIAVAICMPNETLLAKTEKKNEYCIDKKILDDTYALNAYVAITSVWLFYSALEKNLQKP